MRSKQLNEIFRFLANTGVREHEETRHDSGLFCHVHDSAGTCLDDIQLIFVCASVETQLLDSLSQMMWGRPLANEFSYHATQSRAHFLHSFHERVDSVLQLIFGELHSTAEPAVSALLGRLPITTSQPNRLFLNGLGWGPCPPRKTKFPPHMVAQGSQKDWVTLSNQIAISMAD